jgi:hypothetical protein
MVTERNGSGGSFLDQNRSTTITILKKLGRDDIVLKHRTPTTNAAGRIAGFTVATSTILGDLQFVSYEDREILEEGIANMGDAILYTTYDISIDKKDEVVVDSISWRIKRRVEAETIGTGRLFQAWICTRKNVD